MLKYKECQIQYTFQKQTSTSREALLISERGFVIMVRNVVIVGAGAMSEAIIAGMVKQSFLPSKDIVVMNKHNRQRLEGLHETYGISYIQTEKNQLNEADVILLSVKPKDVPTALQSIKAHLHTNQLIISVVAGVSTDIIKNEVDLDIPIIRAMPNTSATIGYSATAITRGQFATQDDVTIAKQLFDTIGMTVEVAEKNIDIVTGLSGSGPAYVYYLVEALEAEAVALGLDADTAEALIMQTVIGAGQMLAQSGSSAKTLREKVTSPKGTTEAGINTLASFDFQKAVRACVKSATNRAIELGRT